VDAPRPHSGPSTEPTELTRLGRELDALHETALALSEHLGPEALYERIIERAAALVDGAHGYLYMLDDEEEHLVVRIATGAFTSLLGRQIQPDQGVAGVVWSTREPYVANDYRTWGKRHRDLGDATPGAVLGVPLLAGGEVVGVIGLARMDGEGFSPADVALMTRFGQLASLAYERAQLTADVAAQLEERRRAEEELSDAVRRLTASADELRRSHEETVRRLAVAAEFRDGPTGRHVERMSETCDLISRALGLDDELCESIRIASALHDVGKIGIPDHVLLKPGPLTDDERDQMERHAEIGYRILAGSGSELLDLAASIALTHHEHFDGTGYPRGLAGDAIPIEGRIAAVADVFDALTSDRVYRGAFTLDSAVEVMLTGRGSHFDPTVLDAFLTAKQRLPMPAPAEPVQARAVQRTPRAAADATTRAVSAASLAEGVEAALQELERGGDARHAIDRALRSLCETAGAGLLASVYVADHERLWCIAQHGYDQVRDGFAIGQGVMGRTVREGTVEFVPDVRADADFIAAVPGIVSELCAAIVGARAHGALNVETSGIRLPEESPELFLPLVAAMRPAVDELGAGMRFDLASLVRMTVYASSLRSVTAIAEFATRTVGRLLDLEAAQLDLGPRASGPPASFWRRPASTLTPISPDALAAGGRAGLSDLSWSTVDGVELGIAGPDDPGRWLIWLPLRAGGSLVGTLVGRSDAPLELAHDQVEAATLFTQHSAALLDVAQALRREQRAAVTDPLTGLLNRRGFDERLREEIARAHRAGRQLAVVLTDCDDLKRINDAHGHERGDAVLQAIAHLLRQSKRVSDVAGRLGGDEFGVVLPDADAAVAADVAERLRTRMRDLTVLASAPTASFGFAVFPDDGVSSAELLRVADHALYEAKRGGKDRLAGPGEPLSAAR
jgi:diguanylate cyclase (GGDEF)-like protein